MIKTPLSTVLGGAFWTPGATAIGGNTPTFDQQIQKLFANGEQGFYQDPYDLGVMYQDAAGTVPVTAAGQAVGLMLDKSKGVAYSENLSNTGKQQALQSQITLNDGWWDIARTTSNFPGISQTSLETNSLYKVKVSWKESISGTIRIEFTSSDGYVFATIRSVSGSWEGYVNSIDKTQLNVYFRGVTDVGYCGSIKIDSIRKVSGNHAYQTTSAARPILQDTPHRIDFDAVDDKLITNLPAQLTGCTVIRSVPNVGTQILTGQTIPVTYEDNTDHCGLIVINRVLTPSETSAITAEFNKRAGV